MPLLCVTDELYHGAACINGSAINVLVETTRADSQHACTIGAIEHTLAVQALPYPRANRDRDNDPQMGSSSTTSEQ